MLAVITDISLVVAYPKPSITITGIVEIPAGKEVYTRWLTKNKNGIQTYTNDFASTWMTSPCPKCQIGTKPYNEVGVSWDGFATKMGETQQFTHNIATVLSAPMENNNNNYRILMFRADGTLLTTNHSGSWAINP